MDEDYKTFVGELKRLKLSKPKKPDTRNSRLVICVSQATKDRFTNFCAAKKLLPHQALSDAITEFMKNNA